MQMIPARMSLVSIVQYMSVDVKLNSKIKAHITDRHRHGNHDRREDKNHREIQEAGDQSSRSEDGKTSSGREYITREDHKDAHFFAFMAHNTKPYGHDKANRRKAPPSQGKEPRRFGNCS